MVHNKTVRYCFVLYRFVWFRTLSADFSIHEHTLFDNVTKQTVEQTRSLFYFQQVSTYSRNVCVHMSTTDP